MTKKWLFTAAALVGLSLSIATQSARAQSEVSVVMSGLFNPRGLAFGADGGLYVAEAGRGGEGPGIVLGGGDPVFYGTTSSVSRWLNGVQDRVLPDLPSLAPTGGGAATGLHDIAFDSSGQAYGIIGFGGDPARRAELGTGGADFGQLVRLSFGPNGAAQNVADVSAFEAAANPDGGAIDSNPYGLIALPGGGFAVTDAGGNDLLSVTAGGTISALSVFPPRPNPLPFGPPFYESVPTAIALGPDNAYYVGELTGFPFPPGGASVYRVDALTGERTVAFSGFTNIIDLTFGQDGNLYVLQHTTNGLASPTGPGPGALIQIDPRSGARTTIASEGLIMPGGVAAGRDGALYVSNLGTAPGGGQVLRIVIPEPGTWVLLGSGLVPLALTLVRRRRA